MSHIKLCSIEDLEDIDSRGFVITEVEPHRHIFIIRNWQEVHAYENICPHTSSPLDWNPDEFLDQDKAYIQCASHGALFEIDNGYCIYGPCMGQSLQKIKLSIEGNTIYAVL